MRLVVDTNVFVSATFKASSWPGTVVRWVGTYGGLLRSAMTEQELFAVFSRPRLAARTNPGFLDDLRRLFAAAELVAITERIRACRDPKDGKFLELAVNGRADAIVSGDADMLALDVFRGIPITTPAAFGRAQVR